jgi:hypothetical protein
MAQERRRYYLIVREQFDKLTAHDALDALRYDGARVEHNPPDGFYLFSVEGNVGGRGPNVERLRSHFGLAPAWICHTETGHDYGHDLAREWAEAGRRGAQ